MILILTESAMVTAFALFLSLFFRPGITSMITLTFLFLSHNHEQLRFLGQKGAGGVFSWIMQITPDAQVWLMDTRIYYEQPLTLSELCLRVAYGVGWAMVFVLMGNAFFYRKNL